MWQQHLLVRQHATGNFATLLKAISRDPAMLVYLDGVSSAARDPQRELRTRGDGALHARPRELRGTDVVEASRVLHGMGGQPPGPAGDPSAPQPGVDVHLHPGRFDAGTKTLLGTTGTLDMDGALDVLLGQPPPPSSIASKLYWALVGTRPPDRRPRARLGRVFKRRGGTR